MKRAKCIASLLLLALGLLGACRGQREREREREGRAAPASQAARPAEITLDAETTRLLGIQVAAVKKADLPRVVRATGRIVAQVQRNREVRTRFAGRVESVAVEINQAVSVGQVLAVLSSPDLPALRAELARADNTVAVAQRTFERQKRLAEIGAGSQRELQQAQAELEAARIERERAFQHIRENGLDPEKILAGNAHFTVSCPQAGVVVERSVNPGELVAADGQLFRLVNVDMVDALLDVYEAELSAVRVGQPVEIRVPAYADRLFRGRASSIGAVLDARARTAQVRVSLSNPRHLLKPEMLCEADLLVGQKPNAVTVPESAVVDDDGVPIVWVHSGEKYLRRPVRLGTKTLRAIEILSGVQAGEQVVTQGGYQLKAMALKARPQGEHEQ